MKAEQPEMPEPNGQRRIMVSVSLHPSLIDAVDFLANEQHRSRSNMVEVLIQHGLVAEASGRVKG